MKHTLLSLIAAMTLTASLSAQDISFSFEDLASTSNSMDYVNYDSSNIDASALTYKYSSIDDLQDVHSLDNTKTTSYTEDTIVHYSAFNSSFSDVHDISNSIAIAYAQ